jgi:hypothetical protein
MYVTFAKLTPWGRRSKTAINSVQLLINKHGAHMAAYRVVGPTWDVLDNLPSLFRRKQRTPTNKITIASAQHWSACHEHYRSIGGTYVSGEGF